MKINIPLLAVAILLATAPYNVHAQLSGTYTIGDSLADYPDFTSAVQALDASGIDGLVVFNVQNGLYEEQIELTEVAGASAENTITFQSAVGDSTGVILRSKGTSAIANFTIQLNGADYFTFREMTIQALDSTWGHAVRIIYEATHNTFTNNVFTGVKTTQSSEDLALVYSSYSNDSNNVFTDNVFQYGSRGLDVHGNHTPGIQISGNTFIDQYGGAVTLYDLKAPAVTGNLFRSSNVAFNSSAVFLQSCSGGINISGNQIRYPDKFVHGIYLYNSDASAEDRALISNNYIEVKGYLWNGINLDGSDHVRVYHNSVHMKDAGLGDAPGAALSVWSGAGIEVMNNILADYSGGYAIHVYDSTITFSGDHNDLYTPAGKLAYYGTDLTSLSAWQKATGQDSHSVSADPSFAGDSSYIVCHFMLDGHAIPLEVATTDIEGTLRDALAPDIGAYEFSLPEKPVIEQAGDLLTATEGMAYQWFVNGDTLPGETGQVLTIQDGASFTVAVTSEDGCTVLSEDFHIIIDGITTLCGAPVSVYPNPVRDVLYLVNLPENERVFFQLEDLSGRKVEHTFSQDAKASVALSHYRVGLYAYRVYTENRLLGSGKITVQ